MKPQEIKQLIDQLVTDYVERKISAYDIVDKLAPIANTETFQLLDEAGMGDVSSLLDMLADIDYYLTNKTFNHHDPSNILQVIDKYYEKIKS